MGIEIERKFLLKKDVWNQTEKGLPCFYRQGYISTDPNKTIRIRIADAEAFITIKGLSVGTSRPEYEYSIPLQDAEELLDNFCSNQVVKVRYKVYFNNWLWEVDEFKGDNDGLIVAEIELPNEQALFALPPWIDKELTGNKRYFNSNLSEKPYKSW